MKEHTKGPWIAVCDHDKNYVETDARLETDDYIAYVPAQRTIGVSEAATNARLIAAAPELLEACCAALLYLESVVDRMDERCGESGCVCTMPGCESCSQSLCDNEIAMCRAAIAKASR